MSSTIMSAQNHGASFDTAKSSITLSRNRSLAALAMLNKVYGHSPPHGEDSHSLQSMGSPSSPGSPTIAPEFVGSLLEQRRDRRLDRDLARTEYLHVLESVEQIQKRLTSIWPLSETRTDESTGPQSEVQAHIAKLYSASLLDCHRRNIELLRLFLEYDPSVAQVGSKAQLERVRSPRNDVSSDNAIKRQCKELTSCIVDFEDETSSVNMSRKLDALSLKLRTATSLWLEKAGPDPNCTLWRIFSEDPFHSPHSRGDGVLIASAAMRGTESTVAGSRSLESWRLEVAATRCEKMLNYRKTEKIHSEVSELLRLSRSPTDVDSVYATERENREAWYYQVFHSERYEHLRPILSRPP